MELPTSVLKEQTGKTGLPVVDDFIQHISDDSSVKASLENTAIIYVHHPLRTSVSLLKGLIHLGAKPGNIFVLGKHYSECVNVVKDIVSLGVHYQFCSTQTALGGFTDSFAYDVRELWALFLRNVSCDIQSIIIADHGGYVLSSIPCGILGRYRLLGLEKTTAGIFRFDHLKELPAPIVNVAECRVKKTLESPLIADTVLQKLSKHEAGLDRLSVFGIVGFGSIGHAISEKLTSMGFSVIAYDTSLTKEEILQKNKLVTVAESLSGLVNNVCYLFGCTGRDITQEISVFENAAKNINLVSCSSGDIEFRSLLRRIKKQYQENKVDSSAVLDDHFFQTNSGSSIRILRGGFPINFDASGESVPAKDIQLTRALALAGIVQCAKMLHPQTEEIKNVIYRFNESFEEVIKRSWLAFKN